MIDIDIAGFSVKPGETKQIDMPVASLYTDTDISMPIHIQRGKSPGPTLFLSAAIHGDELNGIEIIRRVITSKQLKHLKGTLIAVPMVNVYGVLSQSRYMPDRRDLNRSFPGSEKSSLAGRVANLFLSQIVTHCNYGIDLHTGAQHRSNLPQIRANLDDPQTLALAKAFGVPVLLNSNLRDGSLRQAAAESGTRILIYEAGEALRFDELSIRAGSKGVLQVLRQLGMLRNTSRKKATAPFIAKNSSWVRAPASGIVKHKKKLGDLVNAKDILAEIGGPFGDVFAPVTARYSGIIIGKQNIPLIQEGDAMYHIAYFDDYQEVAEQIEIMQDLYAL